MFVRLRVVKIHLKIAMMVMLVRMIIAMPSRDVGLKPLTVTIKIGVRMISVAVLAVVTMFPMLVMIKTFVLTTGVIHTERSAYLIQWIVMILMIVLRILVIRKQDTVYMIISLVTITMLVRGTTVMPLVVVGPKNVIVMIITPVLLMAVIL
jgi:hypothetical protein